MACYSSLVLLLFCLWGLSHAETQMNGFSVELMHLNSPRSPFYNPAEIGLQRVSNVVHQSIKRANYFNQVFSGSPTNTPDITITPYMGAGYIMSYSIGTPPFKLYGAFDTGSDMIWLQCKPCKPCLNQTSPMFDPSKSSTYKTIPCSSPTCNKYARKTNCSSNNQKNCEYSFYYADMTYSLGDLSMDTLTLNSTNGSPISFPGTVIGCGHKNSGSIEGQPSGIIGTVGGPLSLVSQLGSSIGGKFSYCLVPLFSESNSNTSSKLNFGDAAVVSGTGTISTPIVPLGITHITYLATLEALSVGDNRIMFGRSFGSLIQGNMIIDSGSTLTHFPDDVYSKLESAVAAVVKLKRVKDPSQQLSLCYKTTLKQLEVPIITAHFSGADVQLNVLNTFIPIDHGIVCFAFASTGFNGVGTFGSIAHHNFLVGFNLEKNIVSFKPTDCTKQ